MVRGMTAIAAIACGFVFVACGAKYSEDRQGVVRSEGRSVASDDTNPSCPGGRLPLCVISNLDLSGGPRPSDQCVPLVETAIAADSTSFTWASASGQLIDAVIVRGGASFNVYTYEPSVSSDGEALVAPMNAKLSSITFCGTLGAHADAGAPDASSGGSSSDGGSGSTGEDAGTGGKSW